MENLKPVHLKIKPLSVNTAWQGKKFKTPFYKAYEQELLLRLPNSYKVPEEGPLEAFYEFGLNTVADWDNPIKPLQDILQKKYNFDDRRIHKAVVIKKVVKKGDGYLRFSIKSYLAPTED
jgi:Holliday junction resolvase RusA-like endonuclease